MPDDDTPIVISGFWAKVATGLIIMLISAATFGAVELRDDVQDLKRTQVEQNREIAQRATIEQLRTLEQVNAQRYSEILRRLERLNENYNRLLQRELKR